MRKFKDVIAGFEDFRALGEVSAELVKEAEEKLGLQFYDEYKDFLEKCGVACANGHEFMGICDSERLNIVECTAKAKGENSTISGSMYLIEDVGIDKIKTWQNADGVLFQTVGNGKPEQLNMNLIEYVQN